MIILTFKFVKMHKSKQVPILVQISDQFKLRGEMTEEMRLVSNS